MFHYLMQIFELLTLKRGEHSLKPKQIGFIYVPCSSLTSQSSFPFLHHLVNKSRAYELESTGMSGAALINLLF